MKILYISSMFSEDTFKSVFTEQIKPQHAANKYHNLFCEGLAANGIAVEARSSLPLSRANCKRIFVHAPAEKRGNFLQKYIFAMNVPVLKHLGLFFNSFFATLFSSKDTVLVYDALVISSASGAVLAAKLRRKKAIAIVTDLPQFMPVAQSPTMLRINNRLLSKADGYVLLTQQMAQVVNPENKPYIVLEGHVDVKMEHAEHAPFSETSKKVLYAGAIKNEYGIENLCRSFVEIARDNESLHIFGDGDDASVPADYAARYDNVIYHGSVPNSEVVKAELESCLLVNPRPSNQQFTKYSFPSKTLEYMASGTPVLMAKLEGAPREYDDYLFYFDDASENGLSQRLREVLDLPTHELEKLGCINKRFVLEKKNNVVQAKKVLDWIEMSFEK